MYWDRFDICEAYYLFARQYHEGQFSETYAIFGRLKKINFNPSPYLQEHDDPEQAISTQNARDIYKHLVEKYEQDEKQRKELEASTYI